MNDTSQVLHGLALRLDAERPCHTPPAWAEITGPLEEPERVTWHDDGVESLFGFSAPATCAAVAMVANGWGRGLGSGPPESVGVLEPGERRRIRVAVVVTRGGETAGRLRIGDGVVIDKPPGAGRVLDCLLRCFGLPTDPPAVTTDQILASVWLLNLQVAARDDRALTWPRVVGLHPAMHVINRAGEHVPPGELVSVLKLASRAWSWDSLLEAAKAGWLADRLPAGSGAWMDEGMLSRWLMDSWPTPDDLLERVEHLLTPGVDRRLRRMLGDVGVIHDRGRPE